MTILMLVLFLLLIAFTAGFFGFYNVEHGAVAIAKAIFFIFIVLILLSIFVGQDFIDRFTM